MLALLNALLDMKARVILQSSSSLAIFHTSRPQHGQASPDEISYSATIAACGNDSWQNALSVFQRQLSQTFTDSTAIDMLHCVLWRGFKRACAGCVNKKCFLILSLSLRPRMRAEHMDAGSKLSHFAAACATCLARMCTCSSMHNAPSNQKQ